MITCPKIEDDRSMRTGRNRMWVWRRTGRSERHVVVTGMLVALWLSGCAPAGNEVGRYVVSVAQSTTEPGDCEVARTISDQLWRDLNGDSQYTAGLDDPVSFVRVDLHKG
jgi:hypothetical protein